MTARATHARTDVPADSGNPDEIQPSDFTADHVLVDVASLSRSIQPATVTLSSADILALNTTPITLVAAPGVGKRIAVHLVTGAIDYGTTPYTIADHIYVNVGFVGIIQLDALFTATESAGYEVAPTGLLVSMSAAENGSVTISASDSNPTDGDSSAPITVWYSIEDVPA